MGCKRNVTLSRTRRLSGTVKQRPIFYYISEGSCSEPDYIQNIEHIYTRVKFQMIQRIHHDPKKLLNKMKTFIKSNFPQENDKFIILLDRDEWLVDDIKRIWTWEKEDLVHRMVIFSNPCFELWLLRHYTSGVGATRHDICHAKLVQKNPKLNGKSIPVDTFERKHCLQACQFSKEYSSKNWEEPGFTNGERLIELLEELCGFSSKHLKSSEPSPS